MRASMLSKLAVMWCWQANSAPVHGGCTPFETEDIAGSSWTKVQALLALFSLA